MSLTRKTSPSNPKEYLPRIKIFVHRVCTARYIVLSAFNIDDGTDENWPIWKLFHIMQDVLHDWVVCVYTQSLELKRCRLRHWVFQKEVDQLHNNSVSINVIIICSKTFDPGENLFGCGWISTRRLWMYAIFPIYSKRDVLAILECTFHNQLLTEPLIF